MTCLRRFRALVLRGTDKATRATRRKYGLVSKYRTVPGSVGICRIFDGDHPVSEIEEITGVNNTLPFEQSLDRRVMNPVGGSRLRQRDLYRILQPRHRVGRLALRSSAPHLRVIDAPRRSRGA